MRSETNKIFYTYRATGRDSDHCHIHSDAYGHNVTIMAENDQWSHVLHKSGELARTIEKLSNL